MKFAYLWHGRLGAVLAPLLAISAMSGAGLLWLQPLPWPSTGPGPTAEWSRVLDQAVAGLAGTHPGAQIDLVDLPRAAGDPLRIHLRGADPASTGWVDIALADGMASPLRPDRDDVHATLLHLHSELLQADVGPWVLRAVALAAVVGVVMGLRVWWRVRRLRAGSGWRRWHRRIGALAALPLLGMLATGFVLRTPELVRGVMVWLEDEPEAAHRAVVPATPSPPVAASSSPASFGRLLQAAQSALPEARAIRLYAARDGVVRVRLRQDDWNPWGMHNVHLRAADAAVLRTVRRQDLPLRSRYLEVVYPLHAGWLPGSAGLAAGITLRLLWTAVALSLAGMAVSGLVSRYLRPQPAANRRAAPARSDQK